MRKSTSISKEEQIEVDITPEPKSNELPVEYAIRLGDWHTNRSEKLLGQVFTPQKIATFMAKKVIDSKSNIRVLDPGVGPGVLSCALVEQFANKHSTGTISIDAIDSEPEMTQLASAALKYSKLWALKKGIQVEFKVNNEDFIISGVSKTGLQLTVGDSALKEYDVIIMNAPYFKISSNDTRVKMVAEFAGKQTNIYSLFLSVASKLLASDGILVSINPRSFASGRYFQEFRRCFFDDMGLIDLHLFESRKKVFPSFDILQETLILTVKPKEYVNTSLPVKVTTSYGSEDIDESIAIDVRPELTIMQTPDRRIAIPTDLTDITLLDKVNTWNDGLSSLGLEVSTGPVVPFRAKELLLNTETSESPSVPLLWMNNVTTMHVMYPLDNHKPQRILDNKESQKLLLANERYVILRRFSAKEERSRLVSAVLPHQEFLDSKIGIENHLNYIHANQFGLEENLAFGLAVLLNSTIMDRYFRIFNGNTQVNAYDLRLMPLPTKKQIETLGALWLERDLETRRQIQVINELVSEVLGLQDIL